MTLFQPWASLCVTADPAATGRMVKTIETRSWKAPASLIGERIGIHAATKRPAVGLTVGAWQVYEFPKSSPGEYFAIDEQCRERVLPLGAIVGTAVLEACIPMVGPTSINDMRGWPEPFPPTILVINDARHMCISDVTRHSFEVREPFDDVDGQRPYGHFEPGRWAWILTEAKLTTARCPACWGERTEPYDGEPGLQTMRACQTCRGAGVCDPIPTKGRQRVWNWTS